MLGVFLLGLAVASAALAPAVFPAEVYGAWCRVRYGAEPSANGLVMVLTPAGPGEGAADSGPWVRVVFHNVGSAPVRLTTTEAAGGELGFHAADRAGAKVPAGPLYDPTQEPAMSWVRNHTIPPGERFGLLVDLSRWLRFPAPGLYAVRGDRAPLQDEVRCVSNTLLVRVEGGS